jgi:DNA-binding LytR/AlgR family response regulator
MKRVDRLSRNSKGYILEIDVIDFKIPVSRNYLPFIRESLSLA